jgi:hypothetical protein
MNHKSLSRILAVACSILLSFTIAAMAQSGADKPAAPKLVIKQLERNFGEIKKGVTVQHAFTFRNEGKANLEIKNVAPS